MKNEKQLNSTYLVAKYLKGRKQSYIHKMKLETKSNNVGERVRQLRNKYHWQIETISEGVKNGVKVYHYLLIESGEMPKKFR